MSAASNSMLPPMRRSPTWTATMATDRLAKSSSTNDERNDSAQHRHGGSAILVRHRLHCPALRVRPTEYPKSRQPFDDVEEMIGHALQRSPLIVGAALGGQSGKHHEEQDNGKGQQQHDP